MRKNHSVILFLHQFQKSAFLFVGAFLCSATEALTVSLVTWERLQGLLSIQNAIKKIIKKISVEKSFQDNTLTWGDVLLKGLWTNL